MIKNNYIFLGIIYFIATLFSLSLNAATYYVAKTGSDSTGTGTSTNPFKTIPKGVAKLRAGDTLIVRAGIYTETTPSKTAYGVVLQTSGTASAPITIKSEVKGAAIIDMLNRSTVNFAVTINGSYNVISGFRIRNAFTKGILVWGNNNRIVRNEIYYNGNKGPISSSDGHAGIGSYETSSGTVYDSNYIHNNGRPACKGGASKPCSLDHGIYAKGDNETFMNNIITNERNSAIQIAGYSTSSNIKIYNNVFGFENVGVILYKQLAGVNLRNNIFHKNRYAGVQFYNATNRSGTTVTLSSNSYYGNPSNVVSSGGISWSESLPKTSNPMFISETSDWRLQSSSPCINKGYNVTSTVKTDYMATARLKGSAVDIGAYER